MASGAEAVRSTELQWVSRWAIGMNARRPPRLGTGQVRQAGSAETTLAQMACPERGSKGRIPFPRRAFRPLTSCAALSEREQQMDADKYEKSLDNHSAAPVSREPRAPRAGLDRKPCIGNGLRLVSLLRKGRGAQVSRAARPANVTQCHRCDIAAPIRKLMLSSHLSLNCGRMSLHFLQMCDILRHCVQETRN